MATVMRWLGIAFGALSIFFIARQLFEVGVAPGFQAVVDYYNRVIAFLFSSLFIEAQAEWFAAATKSTLPVYWREGIIMLILVGRAWIVAAWRHAISFADIAGWVVNATLVAATSYFVGSGADPLDAAFHAVLGAFMSLVGSGLWSFVRGGPKEASEFAGRDLLAVVAAALLFLASNAGLQLAGL